MDFSDLMNVGAINYVIMAIVVTSAAFLQGVGGVGFAMFAAPIAAFLAPQMVPGALLVIGGSVSLLTAIRERHDVVIPVVGSALLGRVIGTIIATVGMTQLPSNYLGLLFGAFILLAVILSASGLRVRPNMANVSLLGTMSGIMGTLTSVGAPALAIAMQSLNPAQLRASLGTTLFFGSAFSIASLAVAGLFTFKDVLLGFSLWPFMLIGFYFSGKARHKVSPRAIKRLLLSFCGLSGGVLIIKSLI